MAIFLLNVHQAPTPHHISPGPHPRIDLDGEGVGPTLLSPAFIRSDEICTGLAGFVGLLVGECDSAVDKYEAAAFRSGTWIKTHHSIYDSYDCLKSSGLPSPLFSNQGRMRWRTYLQVMDADGQDSPRVREHASPAPRSQAEGDA